MSEQKNQKLLYLFPYYKNLVIPPNKEAIGMNKDIKYLVFGMCVAFVLFSAFAGVGVSVALASARWHVEEGESVHVAVDAAVMHSYEKSCGYNIKE